MAFLNEGKKGGKGGKHSIGGNPLKGSIGAKKAPKGHAQPKKKGGK